MGEYADEAMESALFDYMDAMEGAGVYDPEGDSYDEDCLGATLGGFLGYTKVDRTPKYTYIEFDEIMYETEKARLFKLSIGKKMWVPKSMHILEDKRVGVNQWFLRQVGKIGEDEELFNNIDKH